MKKRPAADMLDRCPLMPFACPMCDACGIFSGGGFTELCIGRSGAGMPDERKRGDAV